MSERSDTQSPEPDYIAQTGETPTDTEQMAWLRIVADEAKGKGCTWARATWSDEHGLLLYEAWKVRPDNQGEPRFFLTYAEPIP